MCILRRAAPTPPLGCGSLASCRVLLYPTRQGWRCHGVMPGTAQPGSLSNPCPASRPLPTPSLILHFFYTAFQVVLIVFQFHDYGLIWLIIFLEFLLIVSSLGQRLFWTGWLSHHTLCYTLTYSTGCKCRAGETGWWSPCLHLPHKLLHLPSSHCPVEEGDWSYVCPTTYWTCFFLTWVAIPSFSEFLGHF